jgi:hypothetical protein
MHILYMQGNAGLRPKVGKKNPKKAIGVVFFCRKKQEHGEAGTEKQGTQRSSQ